MTSPVLSLMSSRFTVTDTLSIGCEAASAVLLKTIDAVVNPRIVTARTVAKSIVLVIEITDCVDNLSKSQTHTISVSFTNYTSKYHFVRKKINPQEGEQ